MGIILLEKGKKPEIKENPINYDNEAVLQNLLEEHPHLLPLKAKDNLMVLRREFSNDGGSADLILTDNTGCIYIVETKLERNTDKRRVIAQLIDYAANLKSKESFESFISKIKEYFSKMNKDFESALETKFGSENKLFILNNLRDNLESGQFFLIVAMDEVDESIENMINYMNKSDFKVLGYELEKYELNDKQEIIVPRIIGSESEARNDLERKVWNDNTFLEKVRASIPEKYGAIDNLLCFFKVEMSIMDLGFSKPGIKDPSASPRLMGLPRGVLSITSRDGHILVQSQNMFQNNPQMLVRIWNFCQDLKNQKFSVEGLKTEEYLKEECPSIPFESWGPRVDVFKLLIKKHFS